MQQLTGTSRAARQLAHGPLTVVVHGRQVRALQQVDGQDTVPDLKGLGGWGYSVQLR